MAWIGTPVFLVCGRTSGPTPALLTPLISNPTRTCFALVSAAALLGAAGLSGCSDLEAGARPPLILITIDAVRADHVSAYGHDRLTTPNIDALAERGMRYDYVLSPTPWSAPAHAALLAGQDPDTLEFTSLDGEGLDPTTTLLPERLYARGYDTWCVLAHEFLHPRWHLTQGVRHVNKLPLAVASGPARHTAVTDAALEAAADRGSRPFFLWVHYEGPRAPFEAPGEPVFEADASYTGPVTSKVSLRGLLEIQTSLDDADRAEAARLYDEELQRIDAELGRLLAGLTEAGLGDAVIAVTSPHGYALGERGHFGDAALLHDDLVRVPWVLAGPGVAHGVIQDPVSLIDVAPTLFALTGMEVHPDDPPMEGFVALPKFPAPARPLFASTRRAVDLRAVVEGDLKLIRNNRNGSEELFDVYADPDESLEMSGSRAIEKDALSRRLDARYPPE
jgi:arylsulfatase A-like enzyme